MQRGGPHLPPTFPRGGRLVLICRSIKAWASPPNPAGGGYCPHIDGFLPVPPSPPKHPRTAAHKDAVEATELAGVCPWHKSCSRLQMHLQRRQGGSWHAGGMGMLQRDITLTGLFILYLIVLRPGAGRVWHGGVRDAVVRSIPGVLG